jgi:hypothetical protein
MYFINNEIQEQWLCFKKWFENEILERELSIYEYDMAEFCFKEGLKRATK